MKGKLLDAAHVNYLIRSIYEEEIKAALFSIGNGKTPRPDGFSSYFFKKSWDIIGRDFTVAVMEFFSSGQILKQINHSMLTLISNSKDNDRMEDFRPIASCNVVYNL